MRRIRISFRSYSDSRILKLRGDATGDEQDEWTKEKNTKSTKTLRSSRNKLAAAEEDATSVEQIFYGEGSMSKEGTSESAAENGSGVIWYMTDDCVTIVLDTYSIRPYAIGPTMVPVSFTTGLLDTDYEVQ